MKSTYSSSERVNVLHSVDCKWKDSEKKDCDINKTIVEATVIRNNNEGVLKNKRKALLLLQSFALWKQFKISFLRKALQREKKSRKSRDDRNNNTNTNIEPLQQQQGKNIYHEI